jgi:rhodanese-related sulfurtransferase
MTEISPAELKTLLAADPPVLLDVREPWEVETAQLPDCVNIPMAQLPQRLAELEKDRTIVVICHYGTRSAQAADFLSRKGVKDARNLTGGIDAWSQEIDSAVPRY